MRIFITGIAGFAGSHLAELLLDEESELYGTVFPGESVRNAESFKSRVSLFPCDIRDAESLRKILHEIRPDEIYHLAAVAFIPDSISDPRLTLETNIFGTFNLLEAARTLSDPPKFLFVGSADEYGLIQPGELPVTEQCVLRPANPYSVSKASASLLAYQYALSGHMKIVRTRSFNHTGPRQSPQFVCSDFARQIVEAEMGKHRPEIHVGSLSPRRDFTDVRDIVRAYRDVLRRGETCDVYNVCSGVAVQIGEILEMLLSISGRRFAVIEKAERARKSDVVEVRGDFRKIEKATGWKPHIPLRRTLEDMIEYWRNAL